MPGFADSFWTPDYVSGLEVLYSKLLQGAMENKQLLTVASIRADAEEQYGVKLGVIAPSVDKLTASGFNKDDGASVRKVGRPVLARWLLAALVSRLNVVSLILWVLFQYPGV